jgi:Fe-S-cluster-containing hydrogenase component 2
MRPVDQLRTRDATEPGHIPAGAPRRYDDGDTELDPGGRLVDRWALPPRTAAGFSGGSTGRVPLSVLAQLPERAAAPSVDLEAPSGRAPDNAWYAIRTALVLDGVPTDTLRDAYRNGAIGYRRLERDALLPLVGQRGLVLEGQIGLGLFAEDALRTEWEALSSYLPGSPTKQELKRRSKRGPLVRLAERTLCLFEDGDVFEPAGDRLSRAYFAVTPAQVVLIDEQLLAAWRSRYSFLDDRFRRAAQLALHKLAGAEGAAGESGDFFVRHGLSVSMTLRVRRLDACFECGACEQACADRYGVNRLSLNGRVLGGLDFVDTCHTCTDARCIDPCNFDAISFDRAKQEVLIKEEACTGCTLCAIACPYDAIEMHELEDQPLLQIRLDKAGALKFGEGTPRKARLRRIASKCDHCVSYEDQACITACPTGALLEMLPTDVAKALPMVSTPTRVRSVARAGYDESLVFSVDRLAARQTSGKKRNVTFATGVEIPEFGRARARRTRLAIGLWWWVGGAAFLVALAEILLRKLAPQLSLAYLIETHVDGIEPEIALAHVDYRPGCQLAMDYGYLGTALMISGIAYVLRRRLPFLDKLGTLQAWFDWHVMSGVIGPLFILLHTAAKLDNWVSFAVWSMIGCVVSGLFGRYLTTQLPLRYSHAPTEIAELSAEIVAVGELHPSALAAEEWGAAYRHRIDDAEARWAARHGGPLGGAFAALGWLIADDLRFRARVRALRRILRRAGTPFGARRKVARLAARRVLLQRRRAVLPMLSPLFAWWKILHVPMSITLSVIGGIHIALAWMAG